MWRARFGRGFGPVVRETTKWMYEWMNEWKLKIIFVPSLSVHSQGWHSVNRLT
jgi:hypothetical protein